MKTILNRDEESLPNLDILFQAEFGMKAFIGRAPLNTGIAGKEVMILVAFETGIILEVETMRPVESGRIVLQSCTDNIFTIGGCRNWTFQREISSAVFTE